MVDYAVIGAGVAGSFVAHYLVSRGKTVTLFDPKGVAGGGSGAAGAFLSPKIGHGGALEILVNEAYEYALAYYTAHHRDIFTQSGLLHLQALHPTSMPLATAVTELLHDTSMVGAFISDAGTIDPIKLCESLTQHIPLIKTSIDKLVFDQGQWHLNDSYHAHHVVLATGASMSIWQALDVPYMELRPVWGERIEVTSDIKVPCNYHDGLSVSATQPNGHIIIGATHRQHTLDQPLDHQTPANLLDKASKFINLGTTQLVDHRGGTRAGAYDYMPLVGLLIEASRTLEQFPNLTNGAKIDPKNLCYYPNISMINGLGGRGFVLAPYVAYKLVEMLLEECPIDSQLAPARLFLRYAKGKGVYYKYKKKGLS